MEVAKDSCIVGRLDPPHAVGVGLGNSGVVPVVLAFLDPTLETYTHIQTKFAQINDLILRATNSNKQINKPHKVSTSTNVCVPVESVVWVSCQKKLSLQEQQYAWSGYQSCRSTVGP